MNIKEEKFTQKCKAELIFISRQIHSSVDLEKALESISTHS